MFSEQPSSGLAAFIALVVCASCTTAPAQLQQQQLPVQALPDVGSPLVGFLPQLRTAPAPDWVRPGLRINYYSASASIPQERFYVYRNERGNLIKTDELGPAGEGILRFDLVALDNEHAVGAITVFLLDATSGLKLPMEQACSIGLPGAGGAWANPGVIRAAVGTAGGGLLVVRMPYPINGTTYDCIRFDYQAEGAHHASVFDANTGLLLYYTHALASPDGRHVKLALLKFMDMRQIEIPWEAGPAPQWAAQGATVNFQGAVQVAVPGSPTIPMPLNMVMQATDSGATWSKFHVVRYLSGMINSQADLVSGPAQILGAYWLPPAGLAALRDGMVLDSDPTTGTQVTVSTGGTDQQGNALVLIAETGNGHATVLGYSKATGELVYINERRQVGVSAYQAELQKTAAGF